MDLKMDIILDKYIEHICDNNLDMCKHIINTYPQCYGYLRAAYSYNNLELVKYISNTQQYENSWKNLFISYCYSKNNDFDITINMYKPEYYIPDDYVIYLINKHGQKMIDFYIDNFPSINNINNIFRILLNYFDTDIKYIEYLHQLGADPKNKIALYNACENSSVEIVNYLVQHGADITSNYNYPLRTATRKNNIELCKYLLDIDADMYSHSDTIKTYRNNIYLIKYVNDNFVNSDPINYLSGNNSSDSIITGLEKYEYNIFYSHPNNIFDSPYDNYILFSSLEISSMNNDIDIIKLFINYGADVNYNNGSLMVWPIWNNNIPMLQLLIDNGFNVSVYDKILLEISYLSCNIEAVQLLIKYGANKNVINSDFLKDVPKIYVSILNIAIIFDIDYEIEHMNKFVETTRANILTYIENID